MMSPLYTILCMKSPIVLLLPLLLLLVLITIITTVVIEAAPNETVVQNYCDQNSWLYGYYDDIVPEILQKVASDASSDQNYIGQEVTSVGYYFYVYSYGECNTVISSPTDCYDCLCDAASQLTTNCEEKNGGWVKMADCMVEYEVYDFS